MIGSNGSYQAEQFFTPTILPALRELLCQNPSLGNSGPEELRYQLCRYLPQRPGFFEVEMALEALRIEGQVLA